LPVIAFFSWQKILIVQAQLLQTCPGHAGQLELHLFGGRTGLASFSNILHSAARRLNHLIMGPALFIDVPVTEPYGHII
jgi:hypothetical protein